MYSQSKRQQLNPPLLKTLFLFSPPFTLWLYWVVGWQCFTTGFQSILISLVSVLPPVVRLILRVLSAVPDCRTVGRGSQPLCSDCSLPLAVHRSRSLKLTSALIFLSLFFHNLGSPVIPSPLDALILTCKLVKWREVSLSGVPAAQGFTARLTLPTAGWLETHGDVSDCHTRDHCGQQEEEGQGCPLWRMVPRPRNSCSFSASL